MVNPAAKFVSYIFHPLLMPTYAYCLLFWMSPILFTALSLQIKFFILITVFTNTFIFPLLITFLFLKLGFVKSLLMQSKKERIIPFALTILIYGLLYFRFKTLPYPSILSLVLLAATITLTMTLFINMKWKVSIHCIGIASLAGILFSSIDSSSYKLQLPLMAIFLIAGIIGTARLALLSHRPVQIYLGYLVGWVSSVLVFNFFS